MLAVSSASDRPDADLNGCSGGLNASADAMPKRGQRMGVVIHLSISQGVPLTGTARAEEGSELAFEGWLELLGAIAQLMDHDLRAEPGPEPGDHEPDPRQRP
jgi:hypothetical protein